MTTEPVGKLVYLAVFRIAMYGSAAQQPSGRDHHRVVSEIKVKRVNARVRTVRVVGVIFFVEIASGPLVFVPSPPGHDSEFCSDHVQRFGLDIHLRQSEHATKRCVSVGANIETEVEAVIVTDVCLTSILDECGRGSWIRGLEEAMHLCIRGGP